MLNQMVGSRLPRTSPSPTVSTLVVAAHAEAGNILWGRLWPNVVTGERVGTRLEPDAGRRVFPWLDATSTSNPKAGGRATTPNDVHPLQVHSPPEWYGIGAKIVIAMPCRRPLDSWPSVTIWTT